MRDEFPGLDNVDVYAYENNFDYARFKPNARLKMCNVPWCGDYENVVKFTDDAARDAWFDTLTGDIVNLDTMFNVKPDGSAKVPVPITSAQKYNYLVVDLPRMTSEAQPIAFADGERKARYFYFIQDAQQLSPNTTRLILSLDMWTTYINDMRFDYILLERGHAPVAASPLADYLADPRGNSTYLLTADVNTGGEPYIERSRAVKNYSAESQLACIATACNLQGDLGSASAPRVPAISEPATSGILAPRVYAVAIADLQKFLRAMEQNAPWIKQTVQGVFFAPANLLTQSGGFMLWGVSVNVLNATQKVERFMKPKAADFGLPARAAKFSKLYTYPYSAIRVSDERGASSLVRVEDLGTQGIEIASAVNLVMPYVSIDARLLGIAGATDDLAFQTMEGRTYSFGGAWGNYLKSWNLPIMQVVQSAASRAAYTTVYNRAHAKLAADNSKASALASNATALANALAANSTAQTNANNAAANTTANNALAVAANNQSTARSNAQNLVAVGYGNTKLLSDTKIDNATSSEITDVKNDTIALTTANNQAAGVARSVANVVIAGAAGGVVGAGIAAYGAVMDNAINVASTNAASAISQSSNSRMASLARSNATQKALNATGYSGNMNSASASAASAMNEIRNNASTGMASNNAGLTRTNASNSKTTGDANANRSKSTGDANANRAYATAIDAIRAGLDQAGVASPAQFGANANVAHSATEPRALFAQIVTQRECDIMNAASAFARYGYSLMREWDMNDMQVMKHFTYWKCTEVWCTGTGNTLESAQSAVKDIMMRGVTVWSKPEEIGRVSIYDNFKEA